MSRIALAPLLVGLSVPALAGVPGEEKAIISGHAAIEHDAEARDPLAVGGELRVILPQDLDFRVRLVHTRLPPRDIESFMRANPQPPDATAPGSLAFSRWESRFQAGWSLHATERDPGLRLRLAGLGVISGTSGATAKLDPIGWSPDYTAAFQAGPTATIGWATPLSDRPTSALLDVRLGGSIAVPITAGGGRIGRGDEDRAFALTVDDRTFGSAGLVGRETRAWVEGNVTWRRLIVTGELGLEHNARSAVRRARAASPSWDVVDAPERVAPHAAVLVGVIF
jgi:hypothetical protein